MNLNVSRFCHFIIASFYHLTIQMVVVAPHVVPGVVKTAERAITRLSAAGSEAAKRAAASGSSTVVQQGPAGSVRGV